MSEYWVSKKKYFCKYCDIYIADDAPSRQQHENGLRHKGNTERFIRGLYKGSEKRKKDAEEEKRDMARVEQAAQAAFAQDVASGLAKPTNVHLASTSSAPRKPAPKPSNPFTNYSTAASLGYQDPDAERYSAEAERRRTQGVVGDWELIASSATPSTLPSDTAGDEDISGSKRTAETPIDGEDARQFKLRKKTATLGEIYDPGLIPIRVKKKEEPVEPISDIPSPMPSQETPTIKDTPKWTPLQWKRPGEIIQEKHEERPITPTKPSAIKEESIDVDENCAPLVVTVAESLPIETQPIKTEDTLLTEVVSSPPSGSMFRKRKAPTGGNRGKRAP